MSQRSALDSQLGDILDPDLASVLATEFGYHTAGDLLLHTPMRYYQHGKRLDAGQITDGERVTIIGQVLSSSLVPMRKKKGSLLRMRVQDNGRPFDITFFQPWGIKQQLTPGTVAMFDGNVRFFNQTVGLAHPEYLVIEPAPDSTARPLSGSGKLGALAKVSADIEAEGGTSLFARTLIPIYRATSAVTSWEILGAVVSVLRALSRVEDPLDLNVKDAADLMDFDDALRKVHFPDRVDQARAAARRLRFDEAIAVQLYLGARRRYAAHETAPVCTPVGSRARTAMEERLPFELTRGQQAVVTDISADLARASPMNRLLQGEVGSGKTIVALLAMLQVVDSGRQAVLMAPTEVLAAQHHRSLCTLLGGLAEGGTLGAEEHSTAVALLTGSMSMAARKSTLLNIVTGDAGIVVGTHAVIQDSVEFFDLGLVVVDEQHRFGVRQRDRLRDKGRAGTVPHLLVMTATPIPRTIAMTVFGDLEVSELSELPGGRKPITSQVVPARTKPAWLDRAWVRVREEVAQGRRVYIVCNRIGDEPTEVGKKSTSQEEEPQTFSVVELAAQLADGPLAGLRVGIMHGRLSAEEKDTAMADFSRGEIDVLVSTTVIEVGVDVPEASMMVIMDAERFGVSQLHQLRGRIGRGGLPGLCLLVTGSREESPAMERLRAIAATKDGFALSRLDLAVRREGDILGDAQSGVLSRLKLLSVVDDGDLIELAHAHADELLNEDPQLVEHRTLAERVARLAGSESSQYLFRS